MDRCLCLSHTEVATISIYYAKVVTKLMLPSPTIKQNPTEPLSPLSQYQLPFFYSSDLFSYLFSMPTATPTKNINMIKMTKGIILGFIRFQPEYARLYSLIH